jgi:hypothetical protein
MLSVAFYFYNAECHYAECFYVDCRYAECWFAECQYAECHGTLSTAPLGKALANIKLS